MKIKRLIFTSAVLYGTWKLIEHKFVDEEVYMSFEQRCRKYGFNTEKHFITTDDGYILQMFRVINPKDDCPNKIPVLLQHGFQDCCIGGIVNGDKSPITVLSRNGFDVWVGNNRGTSFSRLHKTLNPDTDPEYWDFCFEEMGLYDTKAEIGFIKKETGHPKVAYIGNSQGSSQMFYALACNNDWYRDNMSIFIALCPILKPGIKDYLPSVLIIGNLKILQLVYKVFKIEEFPAKHTMINKFYCALQRMLPEYGDIITSQLSEGNPFLNDPLAIHRVLSYFSEGYSKKSLYYLVQTYVGNRFAKYDYGEEENLKRYGTPTSPIVDISKIRDVPIAIFCGIHDRAHPVEASRRIRVELHPSVLKHYQELNYGHITFMVGKDASYLDDVQRLIREYSK